MNKMHSSGIHERRPLALIAGPTASGKSALALRLAELTGGTVINADASQLYRDLRVLTARPSPAEEACAPHLLFGTIDGATPCSAADWAIQAKNAIAEVHAAGRLPILVGGTGLYIRTLIDGIAPVPPIDPGIRADVRALTVDAAYSALTIADPALAIRLRPTDTTRIARALEVVRSTGISLDQWRSRNEGGIGEHVHVIPAILLPPREWLYARANARFESMLAEGAIDEVESLMARKLDPMLPVMRAIGVREVAAWRMGEITRDMMVAQASTATRQYAKRQFTWFSRQLPSAWNQVFGKLDDKDNFMNVIKLLISSLTH